MGINIRDKGKSGEYEVINRLQPFFPNTLERELEQVRHGGSDIKGSWPFAIEVKRVEKTDMGNKNKWWKQVSQCTGPDEVPVVAFRPNRTAWRYLIPASLLQIESDDWMETSETVFLQLVIDTFRCKPAD